MESIFLLCPSLSYFKVKRQLQNEKIGIFTIFVSKKTAITHMKAKQSLPNLSLTKPWKSDMCLDLMYINRIFQNIFYCSVIEYIWPLKDYSKTFCWYWVKMRYDDNPVSISGHRDSINRRNSSIFLFLVMLEQLEKKWIYRETSYNDIYKYRISS